MKRLMIALAMMFAAGSAHAGDFVLVFPVELSGLPPDVQSAHIRCRVLTESGREMGNTTVIVPLVNGAYSGQVRARILPSGYPASADPVPDGHEYRCGMELYWTCTSATGADGLCTIHNPERIDPDHPAASLFRTRTGAPLNAEFDGTFDSEDAEELPRRLY